MQSLRRSSWCDSAMLERYSPILKASNVAVSGYEGHDKVTKISRTYGHTEQGIGLRDLGS